MCDNTYPVKDSILKDQVRKISDAPQMVPSPYFKACNFREIMKYKSALNLIAPKEVVAITNDNEIPSIIKPPVRKRKTADNNNIQIVKDIDKDLNTWYDAYQKTLSNGTLKGVIQRKNAGKLKINTKFNCFPFVNSPVLSANIKGECNVKNGKTPKVA